MKNEERKVKSLLSEKRKTKSLNSEERKVACFVRIRQTPVFNVVYILWYSSANKKCLPREPARLRQAGRREAITRKNEK